MISYYNYVMGATYGGYLISLLLRDGGYLISYYNYMMGGTYGGYLIINYN